MCPRMNMCHLYEYSTYAVYPYLLVAISKIYALRISSYRFLVYN
jgi:hypothetical protein